jgi:hypothetical protein
MSKRRIRTVTISCGCVGITALALFVCYNAERWAMAAHQRSVTRSLAFWEQEDSRVRNWQEVDHAIGLLEYVQGYYVPGPGYHSDPVTEAALEAQRARTLAALAAGLRQFCGADFGADVRLWREWRKQHGPRPPKRE